MNNLTDFHHYKGNSLTRFEKVEKWVMEQIQKSKIPDDQREDSVIFEFMHAAGCMQIARLLAQKRGLDVDIASVAAILHDIYVIKTGKYKNHGPLGAEIAEKILKEFGFPLEEEITIVEAVYHHSEKEFHSDDPYVELVKDTDVFDCSLYKNAEGFYQIHKPEHIFNEYVNRIKKVRDELGLKAGEVFR